MLTFLLLLITDRTGITINYPAAGNQRAKPTDKIQNKYAEAVIRSVMLRH